MVQCDTQTYACQADQHQNYTLQVQCLASSWAQQGGSAELMQHLRELQIKAAAI